jgi:hypothetical protein
MRAEKKGGEANQLAVGSPRRRNKGKPFNREDSRKDL